MTVYGERSEDGSCCPVKGALGAGDVLLVKWSPRKRGTLLTRGSLFVLNEFMEMLFKVVEVAPSGDRIVATADNLAVARAAYDTAVALWPNLTIELRQKARVISRSG
jgi:hypothetical protein